MDKKKFEKASKLNKEISDLEKVVSGVDYMMKRYREQKWILKFFKSWTDDRSSAAFEVPDSCSRMEIPLTDDTVKILYDALTVLLKKKKEEFDSID